MNTTGPIFDPTTHYRIELQGQVDPDWLQSFEGSAEIVSEDASITVVNVYADQSGIIGLLRRLHGLGVTIRQIEILD